MDSFEKISKMNLADLDRPAQEETDSDAAENMVTVADVEDSPEAGVAGIASEETKKMAEKKHMRAPEGQHYYMDAKVTEKEMIAFLFGHNYRQPLMLVAVAIAVIWPIMIIVRNDSNMILAIALAAIVLIALPFSTWSRGKRTIRTSPIYQNTFHYMVDEWGVHLELGDDCVDAEWSKVYKCTFMKSVTTVYTGKLNAFLIPTAAMGDKADEINAFIKKMKAR